MRVISYISKTKVSGVFVTLIVCYCDNVYSCNNVGKVIILQLLNLNNSGSFHDSQFIASHIITSIFITPKSDTLFSSDSLVYIYFEDISNFSIPKEII